MRSKGKSRDFVCHILKKGVKSNIRIHAHNSPTWARSAGIFWRAPGQTVTDLREGNVIRLVLRDMTGGAREIEWDPITFQVTLRRSELWSKPLYFYLDGGELVVSDSLRQIIQVLPKPPELHAQALEAYLALEFFPAPLTPFRGIYKVGVEETCLLNLSTQIKKWTTNPLPERSSTDLDQGVEDVHEALYEVIDKHAQRCPGEFVLLCSGGLDSTILAHHMRGRGNAIVLSYINSWKDEVQRARQTAGHAKLPLQEIRLPAFSTERFSTYASLLDEPLGGTCGYTTSYLCEAVGSGAWILGGHGTGTLSLMNFNHKHLRDSLKSGSPQTLVDRFSQHVSYMDREARARLFEYDSDTSIKDPVKVMLERELPFQKDEFHALQAVIRRQLCVAEETTQFWPIYGAFEHTPVMPFFEPRVHMIMDRLPEFILRNARYERQLLGELAKRYCPGYVPQPRQLGYGLPLGLPTYPNETNMEDTVFAFSRGPLSDKGLAWILESCRITKGREKFYWLRRLWAAILLHAWLEQNTGNSPSSGRNRNGI